MVVVETTTAGASLDNMDEVPEENHVPHINLVFIGPKGCGKSTTAGRLIADCGAIDRTSLDRIVHEAAECGQSDRQYAWILDTLRCERDGVGTVHVALWRLTSRSYHFLLIDSPGHEDFVKHTVTAISQANVAVLVVTAVQADLDVGRTCKGQIREHALLAYILGLRRLVVCVNKMDSEQVGYSKEKYEMAKKVVRDDLWDVGYKAQDVLFVPTSSLAGDNIAHHSNTMSWYAGPTLLEALDHVASSHKEPQRPLRIPIKEVLQIGGTGVICVGRVESGTLRSGARLVFAPGNIPANVLSLEMHHEKLDEAVCGDIVNVHVDVPMKKLRRGMVGSPADAHSATECSTFLAQIIVLSMPRAGEFRAGSIFVVDCHTATVSCVLEELLSRTDRRTGKVLEMRPHSLQDGDAAVVRFKPQDIMCVEPFSEYPPLGQFAVRDQKTTIAIGVVQEVMPVWTQETAVSTYRSKPIKAHCTAKAKVHGVRASLCVDPQMLASDADIEADTDPAEGLVKPMSLLMPASSPFSAFGANSRGKAKAKSK